MTLPRYQPGDEHRDLIVQPLNPIFESMFEVHFTGLTSDVVQFLHNCVSSYKVLTVEESATKMLRIDFEVNIETIQKILSQLNYIQSVEILHHDSTGKVIYSIGSDRLRLNRFTAQGDYQSSNLQKLSVYWEYLNMDWKLA
jgi:hypothetical protein